VPVAVVDLEDTKDFPLKSLPEGYVTLRRLTYGQKLHRQSMAMQMSMRGQGDQAEAHMSMQLVAIGVFDFGHCIVDHNLEDKTGRKLSFTNGADLQKLDPRIGEEIDRYINKMNNFEDTDEVKNSDSGSEAQ
jgi:hypothetical protein